MTLGSPVDAYVSSLPRTRVVACLSDQLGSLLLVDSAYARVTPKRALSLKPWWLQAAQKAVSSELVILQLSGIICETVCRRAGL